MTKRIFMLPVLMAVTAASVFATPNPDKADPRTEAIFKREFAGAHDVKWTSLKEGLQKVTFVWGGIRTIAYFNERAELVGSVRNVFYDHVPLSVVRTIGSRFSNPVVIEVTEISNPEGTSYKMILEQKNKRYQVRINSSGTILEKERIKK